MTSPDLCQVFADHIVGTRFEALPADAVEGAKKSILDILGVILAAGGMEHAVRGVVDLARQEGGTPECSVLGFGGRLPAMAAAFANGAMAHCLDYDDQTPWGQHSGSSILPAVFAVAERLAARRGKVSGREMITAIAVGQDLFHRLIPNVGWRKDWNFSTVTGVYCATAACTHLLGLSREQVAAAFGIASMQSCGTMAVINATGSDLRALYAAFPARGAVTAALMAEKGVSGVPTIFEGRLGIFEMYFGNEYDRAKIVEGLGRTYSGGRTLYKQWPAVGTSHSHVHATIGLMREHGIDAAQIDQIRVFVGDYHRLMCEPLDARGAHPPRWSRPSSACPTWWPWPRRAAACACRTSRPRRCAIRRCWRWPARWCRWTTRASTGSASCRPAAWRSCCATAAASSASAAACRAAPRRR